MKIGYAMCGSFCTIGRSTEVLASLAEKHGGWEFIPIISEHTASFDTRFGSGELRIYAADRRYVP